MSRVPDSQHFIVPQSSLPSHVAAKPVHDAVSAMHVGTPAERSAQHFCVAAHVVAPHNTPALDPDASIELPPLHVPFTHC
jgi:hypothetical protein